MAITLTVAQLSAALRVGDSAEETAEATRLLAYASAAVTQHAPLAPDVVQDEAVVRLASYEFDRPTASRGDSYANAMRNSGAGRILLPYVVHGLGATEDATAQVGASGGGFTLLGSEAVDVATASQWVATTLPVPTTTVGGVDVRAPDGTETGIELFRRASLNHDSAAVGGDATAALDMMFAIEQAADGALLFASQQTGRHTVYVYEFI